MNTMSVRHRQQGVAMASVVLAIALVVLSIVTGWSNLDTQQAVNRIDRDRQAYLREVKAGIERWYLTNLATIDASDDPPDPDAVLTQIGIARKFGLSAAVTQRLTQGAVAYRVFAAWLPDEGVATALDTSGNLTNPPRFYTVINGYAHQSKAYLETTAAMQRVASLMEASFRGRMLFDGDGDSPQDNHFRASSCSEPKPGDFPCYDTYADLASTDLPRLAGVDATLTRNAWGTPITASNLLDSRAAAPPYTMALRTVTPWGTAIRVSATQPL